MEPAARMMAELTFVLAVVLWGLLPGLALAAALDLRWSWPERAAAAPGLSLALIAFSAYAAEAIGLRVSPMPVLTVTAGVVAVLAMVAARLGSRPSPGARPPAAVDSITAWAGWGVWLLPLVIISQLEPVATLPLLPPTLHDGLDHANWFRLIYETRSLNPHEVLAPPFGAEGAPAYYPWGLHGWMALLARTTAVDPVAVLIRCLVLVSAAIPLSVYAFTAYLTGRGWRAIAAATLSLGFWWLPYQVWGWGGYALLAGSVAALPFCRMALEAFEDRKHAAVAATAACAIGVLLIHPSAAMFALLATTTVSLSLAAGREVPWRVAIPFVLTLAAAALALSAGPAVWDPIAAFMQRAHDVAARQSGDTRFNWPGLYFTDGMRFPPSIRIAFGALCVVGAIVATRERRARPLLALHLVLALLLPLARYQTWLTSLWYHLPERIWYLQYACLPALAALGIGGILQAAAAAVRRWFDLSRHQRVAWPVALLLVVVSVPDSYATWMKAKLLWFGRHPQYSLTDRRLLADFEWIRRNIPEGELLFNAPADWGLPLPFTGRRTVFWSGGYAVDPSINWNRLLQLLRRGEPYASHAAAELSWRGIRYVYAASLGGAFERGGRLSLPGDVLAQAEGLELVYESPTARIFRARDHGEILLGLENSRRIRFEGFYPVEHDGGRKWRWSGALAQLRGPLPAGASSECFVRLLGTDPDAYQARIDEQDVEVTSRGFRIPAEHVARGEFVVNLAVPAAAVPDGEIRPLGVRVRDVGLSCGP